MGVQAIVVRGDIKEKIAVFMPEKMLMSQIEDAILNTGFEVEFISTLPGILKCLETGEYAVIICPLKDWASEDEILFPEYLSKIKGDTTLVVVIRENEEKVDAYLKGGDIVISPDITESEAEAILDEAIERYELRVQNRGLMEIVEGYSEVMEELAENEMKGITGLFSSQEENPITRSLMEDLRKKYHEYETLYHRNKLLKQRLIAILESTEDDILFILDLMGRIRYINAGVKKIFGVKSDEVKGKRIGDIHPGLNSLNVPLSLSHRALKKWERGQGKVTQVLRLMDKNREERIFDFTIRLLRIEERLHGFLILGRDQTVREVKLSEELRNRMRYENLNRVNLEMRMAKNLDEGYRVAAKNVNPERFDGVVVFIVKGLDKMLQERLIARVEESRVLEKEIEPDYYSVIRDDGLPLPFIGKRVNTKKESVFLSLRAEYFRARNKVWFREEYLNEIRRYDLVNSLEKRIESDSHPLDRVLSGEEFLCRREEINNLKKYPLLKEILEIMDINGELALMPLIGSRGGTEIARQGEYLGALLVERKDGTIDERDMEYLREYCQSVGLALENGHLLRGLYTTVQELKKERSFLEGVLMRISHEIISPLQSILSRIDYIRTMVDELIFSNGKPFLNREKVIKTAQMIKERIGAVDENIERLDRMGKVLLNYRLIKTLSFSTNPQSIDVAEVVEEIIRDFSVFFKRKNADIRNHLKEAELPQVIFDHDVLYVVLSMLMENAVSFPAVKNGKIERFPVVDIDGRVEKDMLVVSVRDNGRGMNKGDIERIFTRLYTGVRTANYREGLGLGLTSAKMLINYFHGEIRPYSEPGKGSLFEVFIPMKPELKDKEKRMDGEIK